MIRIINIGPVCETSAEGYNEAHFGSPGQRRVASAPLLRFRAQRFRENRLSAPLSPCRSRRLTNCVAAAAAACCFSCARHASIRATRERDTNGAVITKQALACCPLTSTAEKTLLKIGYQAPVFSFSVPIPRNDSSRQLVRDKL